MIKRSIQKAIEKRLSDKKAIILYGPRQVGKTTLLKKMFADSEHVAWWNGDEPDIRTMLDEATSSSLKAMIGKSKILVLDEAQRIKNIGITIKLITDNIPDVKVIASGSSSFELANKINEPLTGRKWDFMLFPFSHHEMVEHHGLLQERRLLEHRLVYGYYPDVVNNEGDEIARLNGIANSYLFKDILTWEQIKKPQNLEKLVQALAFQVGSEVSYSELGRLCGLDNETIERYIEMLERAFVVFRLGSLSRNLRSELKKSRKIYFYDNGLRNAVINQFSPIGLRNDSGALWENFLVSERMKRNAYSGVFANTYFWRTKEQQKIDYIEEYNGNMHAFEFKWGDASKKKFPTTFLKAYPDADTTIINRENFEDFLKP